MVSFSVRSLLLVGCYAGDTDDCIFHSFVDWLSFTCKHIFGADYRQEPVPSLFNFWLCKWTSSENCVQLMTNNARRLVMYREIAVMWWLPDPQIAETFTNFSSSNRTTSTSASVGSPGMKEKRNLYRIIINKYFRAFTIRFCTNNLEAKTKTKQLNTIQTHERSFFFFFAIITTAF